MAIVRCENHGLNFPRTKHPYHPIPMKPVGYPKTAAICGLINCHNPGMVFLEKDEFDAYSKGERYFSVKTYTVKIMVE